MANFNPYITNDGSVGLYSQDYDDVYHSTYGALTEAYEKFILPANFKKYFQKNNEIKILDLCFGIGYNTKSFLNFLIENKNIDTIDTDNIICNDTIHDDNTILPPIFKGGVSGADGGFCGTHQPYKLKIYIHAIEKDKNLVQLSPFIKTEIKNSHKNSLPFKNEKISKMLSEKIEPKYKLNPQINYLLLEKMKHIIDDDINNILYDKKYAQYFDRAIIDINSHKNIPNDILYPLRFLNAFLHNIYYRYISTCNKKALKTLKMLDFNFKVSTDDARVVLKNDILKYNFVFLDAFTPTKCPSLWSVDFFRLLYEHLEDNGMILTYSNSAQVRHAMLEAGFDIYKNVIDGKSQGTIAVKNSFLPHPCPLTSGEGASVNELVNFTPTGEGSKIEPLSKYDLGLLKTKAGIIYRDENLNLSNEEIIARHDIEFKNSNLMSASKYKRENLL